MLKANVVSFILCSSTPLSSIGPMLIIFHHSRLKLMLAILFRPFGFTATRTLHQLALDIVHTRPNLSLVCLYLPLYISLLLFGHFYFIVLNVFGLVVSKSGNPGPGPVPKTRAQIRIFFITSLLRH